MPDSSVPTYVCAQQSAESQVPTEAIAAAAPYPQLLPEQTLPKIVAELRHTLKDPRSISDFVLCPPSKVKFKATGAEQHPVRWTILFSLNARNEYGGYTGTTMFAAIFREGKAVDITKTQMDGNAGLDAVINRSIAAKMADCPYVPDEQIQELLRSSGS